MAIAVITAGTLPINKDLVQITFSESTGGGSPVILTGDQVQTIEWNHKEIEASNAYGGGVGVGVDFSIVMDIIALDDITGMNFVESLTGIQGTQVVIPYIQLEFLGGQTITYDSGASTKPIAYFVKENAGETALAWKVTGKRKLPKTAVTIS